MTFEIVHSVSDWYDGPRRGIANYNGTPHQFQSEWGDGDNLKCDTFLLLPIEDETFSLAMKDWAIWRRYETAFRKGEVTADHHPALPSERDRHLELEAALEEKLKIDPARAIRKKAEFRPREDPEWSGYGMRPLEVQWTDPEVTEQANSA